MLLQTSIDAQISNAIIVASISAENKKIETARELVKNYRRFIANHYRRHPPSLDEHEGLKERIVTDVEKCQLLSSIFHDGGASKIDDLDQASAIDFAVVLDEQVSKKNVILDGLTLLGAISCEHEALADLLVTDIVILPSKTAYGGSTSDGLGIIWANPKLNWRAIDAAEFLIHELTHQCMFMDEVCSSHYDYELLFQKENWAQSAILNKLRPVDKVLHSIAVATELLLFREKVGHPASSRAHPPSSKLIAQSLAAISSLHELRRRQLTLMKPRAQEILENCAKFINALDASCDFEV